MKEYAYINNNENNLNENPGSSLLLHDQFNGISSDSNFKITFNKQMQQNIYIFIDIYVYLLRLKSTMMGKYSLRGLEKTNRVHFRDFLERKENLLV